ncbi:hypothetical protein BDL97_06G115600 [Sphagnum fallax]|nr:hypothetical protein BDL97_06G115600 [Sphagnum fallax]
MLLKLCFDAHCLVARFRGYTCSEVKLRHAVTTLSKVEELHWELFRQLLQFVPSSSGELQQQVPGVVFLRRFLQQLERQKQEYGTARPFPITLSRFPCTVFCCGFCQKVLGLEIRCVLSLWKGPRSIENIVWDFFTGKAGGVFLCIFFS